MRNHSLPVIATKTIVTAFELGELTGMKLMFAYLTFHSITSVWAV